MAGRGREAGRSVTSRLLAVLGTFDSRHPRQGLSEIARRAGMPVATVSRLLGELVAGEALARGPDGRYEVGRRLWQLGLLAPVNYELREVALPFLNDIHAATGDVVHLAAREGSAVLIIERVIGSSSVPVLSRMGVWHPLHTTGVGRVLLAEAPPEVQEEVLASLTPMTPRSITDPARLRQDLADTRRRGYSMTMEEMSLGTGSIAVPIRPLPGPPVAALGVVTTPGRTRPSRLVPTLQVAAGAISRMLRGAPG